LLSRAVENGETRPDLDVDCITDFLLAALNVDLYLFQRRELGMDRGRMVRALRLCIDGLRAGSWRRVNISRGAFGVPPYNLR
jgi:hypothetical protein